MGISRVVFAAIVVSLLASPSFADQQTSGQQKCLNKVTASGRR
jgi:hypothetical protein